MNAKKSGLMVAGVLVCVLAGAGIEHVRQVLTTVPEEPDPVEATAYKPTEPNTPRTIVVKDEAAARAAEALKRRVAELERALAEREAEAVQEPPKPQEAPADRQRRQSFADRMEQMKTENPEQYAEMQKRREEFRQSMEQRAQDRADFLAAVDTKNMNDAQKENHAKLVETVARVNELMAQMSQPGAERTPEMRQQIGEAMGSLNELYGQERQYLLEATAQAAGYQGSQTAAFTEHINVIIQNTTVPNMHGGGRGGGGPPIVAPAAVAPPAK